jgi:hypothetical protein
VPILQVSIFDMFENAVSTASLGLANMTAEIIMWPPGHSSLASALILQEALEPVEDGIAALNFSLNNTGTYQVTVFLASVVIPGSPYNLSVSAGPPDASKCIMQVPSQIPQ